MPGKHRGPDRPENTVNRLNKRITLCFLLCASHYVADAQLAIGELEQDGPPVPEQLALFLPVTGELPLAATAAVRYRHAAGDWMEGHPLYRIRPDYSPGAGAAQVADGFAWTIIGLQPGAEYKVEVIVSSGSEQEVRTGSFVTRALPSPAGAPTITIPAGATRVDIERAISAAQPGDVVQFEDGTYDLDGEVGLRLQGEDHAPIVVRGESRDGVILRLAAGGRVFRFLSRSSNIILEDMTLQGSGVDSGISPDQAIGLFQDAEGSRRLTFRRLTIEGFDSAIVIPYEVTESMVYDCTLTGNNRWNQDLYAPSGSGAPGNGDGVPDLHQNLFWNDDGVQISGVGNVVFHNTLAGFGDSLSVCAHLGGTSAECRSLHYYRNDVYDSGDDGAEVDHAFRNITLYDNRFTNSATFISLDPLHGGPFLAARNISANVVRSGLKQNSRISGQFFYNNTQLLTNHRHSEQYGAAWLQFNNGALRSWGYRNNLFLFYGSAPITFWMESTVQDPIDFSHNSWFPDGEFRWNVGGYGKALAEIQSKIAATSPVFTALGKRHAHDNLTEAQPFTQPIVLGQTHLERLSDAVYPLLREGSSPKGTGVVIHNITDGFLGSAPDRGAIITGRSRVAYGDRVSSRATPRAPADLIIQ